MLAEQKFEICLELIKFWMKEQVHVKELSQQICPTIKDRPANNRNSAAPTPHQTPQAAEFATLIRQDLRGFFHHLGSHKIMLVPLSLSDSAIEFWVNHPSP
jgi:hypothetical protein